MGSKRTLRRRELRRARRARPVRRFVPFDTDPLWAALRDVYAKTVSRDYFEHTPFEQYLRGKRGPS